MRRAITAGVCMGLLAFAAGCGSSKRASTSCVVPADATVLAQTADARAWEVTTQRGYSPFHIWTACLISEDRPVELARGDDYADSATTLSNIALAGPYVAYALNKKGGIAFSESAVLVRDLRTGKAGFQTPAVSVGKGVDDTLVFTKSVVLGPSGSVAWIAAYVDELPVYQVRRHNRQGTALLDSGRKVRRNSLELNAGTITWRNGSETRTAPLD